MISGAAFAQQAMWFDVTAAAKPSYSASVSTRYYDSDEQALRNLLDKVPNELSGQSDTLYLPMPNGSLAKYSIFESSIMEDELAAKFPQIKSYKVYGIDDPGASGRVDISPKGFRAMLVTSRGRVFIDPDQSSATAGRYLSRAHDGNQLREGSNGAFQCAVDASTPRHSQSPLLKSKVLYRTPGSLVTYRLAVSATREYVAAVGGTLDTAMAEINTAINRVNQIYERDLGIRFFLVANNNLIIDVAGTAGFTNNNDTVLIDQNGPWIDGKIGNANYDIGHVFSTGDGGLAGLGVVCGDSKADGVTGLQNPTGDGYYIDFVAHELGHQFGAEHSFNGTTRSCASRNAATAYEPGSGSTVMGYANICGAENIQDSSDATFHAGSIVEINTFVAGAGASCATPLVITPANSDPTSVNAGVDRTIPMGTAFQLEGSGVDAGDTLSYQWDQMDTGGSTNAATHGTDLGNNALFRSYVPQPTGIRQFPLIKNQIAATADKAETLPTTARTLNFRLTVRDGKSGQATDDVRITVSNAAGPFAITSHTVSSTLAADSGTTVEWDVAGTTDPVFNCPNVDISLLTFSADGSTFGGTSLADGTFNDGSEDVTIPDMSNARARFVVACSTNMFYDISDADLNITSSGAIAFATTGNSSDIAAAPAIETIVVTGGSGITDTPSSTTAGSSSGGGGSFDNLWLVLLAGLLLIVPTKYRNFTDRSII